jgi:arabinogalactan endo-1,4-beta-galactosidase
VKDMVHVYNGKNNLKHEFIITKNADTGIKYDESKRIYYKLWGGSTTL